MMRAVCGPMPGTAWVALFHNSQRRHWSSVVAVARAGWARSDLIWIMAAPWRCPTLAVWPVRRSPLAAPLSMAGTMAPSGKFFQKRAGMWLCSKSAFTRAGLKMLR